MTRARRCGLVVAQAVCAAAATTMACSTSACRQCHLGLDLAGVGIEDIAEPPEGPLTSLPPTKRPISRICVLLEYFRRVLCPLALA